MARQVNVLREAAGVAAACVNHYSAKKVTVEEIEAALRPLLEGREADDLGYRLAVEHGERLLAEQAD